MKVVKKLPQRIARPTCFECENDVGMEYIEDNNVSGKYVLVPIENNVNFIKNNPDTIYQLDPNFCIPKRMKYGDKGKSNKYRLKAIIGFSSRASDRNIAFDFVAKTNQDGVCPLNINPTDIQFAGSLGNYKLEINLFIRKPNIDAYVIELVDIHKDLPAQDPKRFKSFQIVKIYEIKSQNKPQNQPQTSKVEEIVIESSEEKDNNNVNLTANEKLPPIKRYSEDSESEVVTKNKKRDYNEGYNQGYMDAKGIWMHATFEDIISNPAAFKRLRAEIKARKLDKYQNKDANKDNDS